MESTIINNKEYIQFRESMYYVSTDGEIVNSLSRKVLKIKTFKLGYKGISLYFNGKPKDLLVHRIVSEVFLPNSFNLPQVNHKDGCKANNSVDNLEWCSSSSNITHAYRVLGRKVPSSIRSRSGTDNPTHKKLFQYKKSGEFVRDWSCAADLCRETGYDKNTISRNCTGKLKSCYGYVWSYNPPS